MVDRVLFEDGQAIRAGETLVELESTEEIAQLAQARANQSDAKIRFDRVADLAKSGTESRSRYDEVRTALDGANARVEEIEARIAALEARLAAIGEALGDPALYADGARARATALERGGAKEEVAALLREWESLASELAGRE